MVLLRISPATTTSELHDRNRSFMSELSRRVSKEELKYFTHSARRYRKNEISAREFMSQVLSILPVIRNCRDLSLIEEMISLLPSAEKREELVLIFDSSYREWLTREEKAWEKRSKGIAKRQAINDAQKLSQHDSETKRSALLEVMEEMEIDFDEHIGAALNMQNIRQAGGIDKWEQSLHSWRQNSYSMHEMKSWPSPTCVTYSGRYKSNIHSAVIWWIRNDFRFNDNEVLHCIASLQKCKTLVPVYIHAEEEQGPQPMGEATKLYLQLCLQSFLDRLKETYGLDLLIFKAKTSVEVLRTLISTLNASGLFFSHLYEPWFIQRDKKIIETLECDFALDVRTFRGNLLYEPWEVTPDDTQQSLINYGTVRWFLNACHKIRAVQEPLHAPRELPSSRRIPLWGVELSDLRLYSPPQRNGQVNDEGQFAEINVTVSRKPIDWGQPIRATWRAGEDAGIENLHLFVKELERKFENERFRADLHRSSRLSPYLRFGEISARQVYHAAKRVSKRFQSPTFLRRLAWRDLSYYTLYTFPHMPFASLRPQYDEQSWDTNEERLHAWQRGYTGYPLVDAGMRELWLTGWMHHYVRHVVAQFLIEYLNMDWRLGLAWFHDTLIDGDVAINSYMWQNGGHSGTDQWNFVMHPVHAGKTCDPLGDYVRKFVPELAALPNEYIHCPWEAPKTVLAGAKVRLCTQLQYKQAGGVGGGAGGGPGAKPLHNRSRLYPERIIRDLEGGRRKAQQAVLELRLRHNDTLVARDRKGRDLGDFLPLPDGRYALTITRIDFRCDIAGCRGVAQQDVHRIAGELTRQTPGDLFQKRGLLYDPMFSVREEYSTRTERYGEKGTYIG